MESNQNNIPEVKLGQYKGLAVTRHVRGLSEKTLDIEMRGLARCHQQTAAQLHAAGDEEENHQHRGGVGHSRQRVGVQPQPDDHGIGHRVELRGHHAQDDRKSIPQQRRAHRPMQQGVLCFARAEHLLSGNDNIHRMC